MEFIPLHPGFGVEVSGFDSAGGRGESDIARLRQAFDMHQLLLFRSEVPLSPPRQGEIASWFGEVGHEEHAPGKPWTYLDNAEPAGRAELQFHSDISYMEHPIEGISLHALALPRVPTSTTFVSNGAAWDALDVALRAELRGRLGRHYYGEGLKLHMDWPPFEHWHPVCQMHPRTGREMLYVTEHHVLEIEGLGMEGSAAMLEHLFGVLYAPQRRYEHVWKPGDLLVWDNLAIQHARTRESDPADGPRRLQRVSFGRYGFGEQLAVILRQQTNQPAT